MSATATPVATQKRENALEFSTIVNNLPEELDAACFAAFTMQDEYENETKFRVAFIGEAIANQVKLNARKAVNNWTREKLSWAGKHPKQTVDASEAQLLETKSGKILKSMHDAANKLLESLK